MTIDGDGWVEKTLVQRLYAQLADQGGSPVTCRPNWTRPWCMVRGDGTYTTAVIDPQVRGARRNVRGRAGADKGQDLTGFLRPQ